MATLILPVIQERNNYEFTIDLENTTYIFYFYYNTRAGYWTMNISDAVENLLVANIPILLKVNLLYIYNNPSLPQGTLYALDLTTGYTEANFENFGEDVLLMYDEVVDA